jgi:hypothetical protein
MSSVELRRIIAEWRLRMQRVKDILQPAVWSEQEWRQFSQALALLVRDHGQSWIIDPNVYWDLRWKLQDGGELVCQVEHIPEHKTSLVVAQTGGFASQVGSYTWLWAEFDMEGNFSRDPYWVEGSWREALMGLLLPLDRQSSYLLAGRSETPDNLLLQEGARPNDGVSLALPASAGYAEPTGTPPDNHAARAEAAAHSAPSQSARRLEEPPVEAEPFVPDFESPPAEDEAAGQAATPEEQARFRRMRAKAHFAESLRRIPALNRHRALH